MTPSMLDPISIPVSQQEQVQELQKLMQREGKASLVGKGGEPALELPDVVYSLLLRILQGMQEGKAISIVPFMQDLTTQEAANFLGVAAGARLRIQYPRGFGLPHAVTGVGFHGLGNRKLPWLAFRHGKDEYGIDCAGTEEASDFSGLYSLPAYSTESRKTMEEREFFNETTEQRSHTLVCPKCGQEGEYKVTWVVRRKRAQLPRGADERDRARFAKAQSYMVRRDDKLSCANIRCRKPFEITQLQSLAFLNE